MWARRKFVILGVVLAVVIAVAIPTFAKGILGSKPLVTQTVTQTQIDQTISQYKSHWVSNLSVKLGKDVATVSFNYKHGKSTIPVTGTLIANVKDGHVVWTVNSLSLNNTAVKQPTDGWVAAVHNLFMYGLHARHWWTATNVTVAATGFTVTSVQT